MLGQSEDTRTASPFSCRVRLFFFPYKQQRLSVNKSVPLITCCSAALASPRQILSKAASIRSQQDSVNSSESMWLMLSGLAAPDQSFWWSLCKTWGAFFFFSPLSVFFSCMQTTATTSKGIANVLVPHSALWHILWQERRGRDAGSGGAPAQRSHAHATRRVLKHTHAHSLVALPWMEVSAAKWESDINKLVAVGQKKESARFH